VGNTTTGDGVEHGHGVSRAADGAPEPGPLAAAGDGVDLSLIRWMLGLAPAERLDALQGFVDSVLSLRDGTDAP
jgi:hypothetical protein